MNIEEMALEELEQRAAEIAVETAEADEQMLETLSAELEMIETRKAELKKETEERKAKMEAVASGEGDIVAQPEVKEERKHMEHIEVRSTPEYLDAWVEYQKGRANDEQRALISENAPSPGTIAVPSYVEDRIHTAWENDGVMSRVRRSYFEGNLKVGYEVSAEGAQMHIEGTEAVTEEELVLNFVNLIPRTMKKLVRYTTEILDLRGEAFVDYIVDEIEYQVVKTTGDHFFMLIGEEMGEAVPLIQVSQAAGETLTTADIITAEGKLAGDANPVLLTTRANAAALKAAALSAQYGYDPFDGMEVVYVDNAVFGRDGISGGLAVVADLSGWQANFPAGDDVKFIFDEFTEAPADIVRVVGRLAVGIGIVAPYKTVVITKAGA